MSEYPPLTSLEALPLHGGVIEDRTAPFACRVALPFADVFFDWRCDDCLQRAIGYADAGHAHSTMLWVPKNGDPPQETTLQWHIDRAMYWRHRDA